MGAKTYAQVGINSNGNQPDSSAMLDVYSTEKGILVPRLTTLQMVQIDNPATGLLVFNSDSVDFYFYDGDYWLGLHNTSDSIDPDACGIPFEYEGQVYNTVQIGTQCWMAENLNVGIRVNGTEDQTNNDVIEKYCYEDDTLNCDTYGGMYKWNEVMNYSTSENTIGICPDGWHIPSNSDYQTLADYLGGSSIAGGKIKETGTTHRHTPNYGANNLSGFTGLPGGRRSTVGSFIYITTYGNFWTSSEYSSTQASNWYLYYYNESLSTNNAHKNYGLSIRCIKNDND